jgi:hypothetical protein
MLIPLLLHIASVVWDDAEDLLLLTDIDGTARGVVTDLTSAADREDLDEPTRKTLRMASLVQRGIRHLRNSDNAAFTDVYRQITATDDDRMGAAWLLVTTISSRLECDPIDAG